MTWDVGSIVEVGGFTHKVGKYKIILRLEGNTFLAIKVEAGSRPAKPVYLIKEPEHEIP